jgi:hypothetical protein
MVPLTRAMSCLSALHWLHPVTIASVFAAAVGVCSAACSEVNAAPGEDSGRSATLVEGEPILGGFLIRDGRYVPPPYVVGSQGKSLFLNGRRLVGLGLRPDEEEELGSEHEVLTRSEPARNEAAGGELSASRTASRMRGRLERRLANGMLLVQATDGTCIAFEHQAAYEVLSLLCSTQSRGEKLLALLRKDEHGLDSRQWGEVLDRFQPTAELREHLAELDQRLERESAGLTLVYDGCPRGPLYGLTVAGMVLVVLALGTILNTRPPAGTNWREEDCSESASAFVWRTVLLIVALSGFDLVCTLLAGQTGRFLEVNPLAESLLDSPLALAGFKGAFTLGAVLILWRLRRFRGAQMASWWICLLLTVLTVRWVVVESLLLA